MVLMIKCTTHENNNTAQHTHNLEQLRTNISTNNHANTTQVSTNPTHATQTSTANYKTITNTTHTNTITPTNQEMQGYTQTIYVTALV